MSSSGPPHGGSLFSGHQLLGTNPVYLVIGILVMVAIGGVVEIAPLFYLKTTLEAVHGMRPYTPLELAGRNIYVREGCASCHSQMIRALRAEVERYGHSSLAAESMYDHPFQWGSKRNGPDLARVGGKYSNDWHKAHLTHPQDVVPTSIMPSYAFLARRPVRTDDLQAHLKTLRSVGVPYSDEMIANAGGDLAAQIDPDGDSAALTTRYPGAVVASFTGTPAGATPTEMDAVIAYLQMLGTLVPFQKTPLENLVQ